MEGSQNTITASSDNALDPMAQFMDVITTFKCKGCDFVCYKQEVLVDHVRSVHLPQSTVTPQKAGQCLADDEEAGNTDHTSEVSQADPVNDAGSADIATSTLIASLVDEATNNPNNIEGTTAQYTTGSNLQEVNIQTFVGGAPTDQVVLLDTGGAAAEFLNSAEANQSRELYLCGSCNVGFQTIEACKDHMVKDHNFDPTNLASSKAPSLDLTDLTNSMISSDSQTAAGMDTKSSEAVSGAAVDEMEMDVEIEEISKREEMADGKVSMSTQVVRKKVGRKSRTELAEMNLGGGGAGTAGGGGSEGGESSVTVQSFDEGGSLIPEGDLDFDDPEQIYVEIEVPGKRRRKLPSHLSKDYLMPKRSRHDSDPDYMPPTGTGGGGASAELDEEEDDELLDANITRMHKIRGPYKKRNKMIEYKESKEPHPLKPYHPIKCDLCRARFPTEENLHYHMSTHTNEKDKKGNIIYQCPEKECSEEVNIYQTAMWSDFKYHAWKEHQIDLGLIKCDECGYRATVLSKILIHKQIHGKEKPYVCDICKKGFKQLSQLKNHVLVHVAGHELVEKESVSGRHWFVQAQCEICKRTFANQKSLQCHIEAVHEKIKPFACKFCGHTAARKAMMQLHMRTHTGEKPFRCDLCEYVTADHNSMRRHRMRHTGDKPYQCPHCTYACIQAVSLKLHLKSKHPGSNSCFACNKCPYRSVSKHLFSNHMRDHEMGLIDESQLVPISEETMLATSGGLPLKLGPINDLTNGASNTTQLICSALNAIAPSLTEEGEPLPENIETTIHTISNEGGLKAHKITFHIPAIGNKNAKTAEVVVQEQTVIPDIDPLQAATIQSEIPTEATLEMEESLVTNSNIIQNIQQSAELEPTIQDSEGLQQAVEEQTATDIHLQEDHHIQQNVSQ